MSKTLKIVIYLLLMLGLFIWLSKSIEGCNTKENTDLLESAETATAEEDLFEDGESDEEDEDALFEGDNEPIDYTALDEAIEKSFEKTSDDAAFQSESEVEETTDYTQYDKGYSDPTPSSSSGNYLVIAGSFLQADNARKMVNKLNNMGYSGAETLVFDGSAYQTVIAGKYDDNAKAVDVTYQLKNKGIDCYVHRKKY